MRPDAAPRVAILTSDDPVFALGALSPTLPALRRAGYDVAGLWVVPDRMGGLSGGDIGRWYLRAFGFWPCLALGFFRVLVRLWRAFLFRPASLESLCRRQGIGFFSAPSANDPQVARWLQDQKIDHLLILTGEILRPPVLSAVRGRVINCHGSLLPSGRGLFPQVHGLVHARPQGISFHGVAEKIDDGPVYGRHFFSEENLPRTVTGFSLALAGLYPDGALPALQGRALEPLDVPAGYDGLPTDENLEAFQAKGGQLIGYMDFLTVIILIIKGKF